MRPDLPVGSPEREAYFAEKRKTFVEDWAAAEEAVRLDRIVKQGDLYFIRAGDCVKIGHTANVWNRIAKMQADNHEQLDCLLVLKGQGHEEKKWHRKYAEDRVRGEWFRATPDLEAAIVWLRQDQADAA